MAVFQNAFSIITANDVPGIASLLNKWGNILAAAVAELRGAVLLQSGGASSRLFDAALL